MGIPAGELADRLTSSELTEYAAFCEIEPFGDEWRRTATGHNR